MSSNLPLILVVDDNPENLTVIGELLQPAHAVRAANGGARGLRLARLAPQPDLILLDVMMPEMDGYEVLAQLRADPATADIPVIFVTALNSGMDEEHGLALGAVDYISKPIKPGSLLARLRTQLAARQRHRLAAERIQVLEQRLAQAAAAGPAAPDDPQALPRLQAMAQALLSACRQHGFHAPALPDHGDDAAAWLAWAVVMARRDEAACLDAWADPALPLAARVVALAGAFETLIRSRPPRAALSHRQAAEHLRSCAPPTLEPALVAALAQGLPALSEIARQHGAPDAAPAAAVPLRLASVSASRTGAMG